MSTRLAASLGIVLAASWGPLSLAFHFIEVSETGKPDAARSIRIVLARDFAIEKASRKTKTPASKKSSENEKPTTERLLNAAPETLESAQSIHFDLSGVPVPLRVSAWKYSEEVFTPQYFGRLFKSSDSVAHSPRGPPNA